MIPEKIQSNAKKDFILLLVVSALFLGYFFLSGRTKPDVRQTPATPETLNPDLVINIAADVDFPQLPPRLNVYQAEAKEEDLQALGQELATAMKLHHSGTAGWINLAQDAAIIVNLRPEYLMYYVNAQTRPTAFTGPDKPEVDSALQAATDFVNRIFPDARFKTDSGKATYFIGGLETYSGDSDNYDLISFEFSETVNGYPLRRYEISASPVQILIGQKNQVVKFTYDPQSITYNPDTGQAQALYSREEILNRLKSKDFKIANVDGYPEMPVTASELVSLTLESVTIEYRFEGQELKPSLLITGSAISNIDTTARVRIILPATKTP